MKFENRKKAIIEKIKKEIDKVSSETDKGKKERRLKLPVSGMKEELSLQTS